MKPFEYLEPLLKSLPKDTIIVASHTSNTNALIRLGITERALLGLNMGIATPVGLGIALGLPHRRVVILEGDGGVLLLSPALTDLGTQAPKNVVVVVNDNESTNAAGTPPNVSGFPSHTAKNADIEAMARAVGIKNTKTVRTLFEFKETFKAAMKRRELAYIVVKTEKGRIDVPKGSFHPYLWENKFAFARYIEKTEKKKILTSIG